MIMTGLMLLGITIVSIVMNILGTALPNMNLNALRNHVDTFIDIQRMGLAGFKFLVGDVGITLIGYALAIYIAYYGVLIIYEIVVKIFLKGQ